MKEENEKKKTAPFGGAESCHRLGVSSSASSQVSSVIN